VQLLRQVPAYSVTLASISLPTRILAFLGVALLLGSNPVMFVLHLVPSRVAQMEVIVAAELAEQHAI